MFKLIKIINSGVNVPEPVRMPKASGVTVKRGTLLTLSQGVVNNCTATTAPRYVALADAAATDTHSVCAEISESMRFDAPVTADPASLTVGAKVTLATDTDGAAYGVTATTASGVATVVDLCAATAAGDMITVKF